MLGYRKKSFQIAHALLRDIGADPGNLAALSSLQVLLIDEIVRAEEKIRTLKRALTRIETKDSAEAPGKNAAYLSNRIDRLRQLAFVWRCFGDGIAFVYMDRFALKQTYYNTHNHNAKQDSGFLGGKGGLEHELAVLEEGLAAGIPCLLTDLTNTIRHGDVCFMVGPDPRLVEVKTGRKLDKRGRRQAKSIEQLQRFFQRDHATGLRGFPEIRRAGFERPDLSYIDQLNACIDDAIERGYAIVSPECGLFYIAMTNRAPPIGEILKNTKAVRPWASP